MAALRDGVEGGPNPAFLRGTSESRLVAVPFAVCEGPGTPLSESWYEMDAIRLEVTLDRVVRPLTRGGGNAEVALALLLSDDELTDGRGTGAWLARDVGRSAGAVVVGFWPDEVVPALIGEPGRDETSGTRFRGDVDGVDGLANAIDAFGRRAS